MINTVLLDLDDTIFDFKACERQALVNAFLALGIPFSEEVASKYTVINDSVWKKLERREITRERLKVERFRILLDECGLEADPERLSDAYADRLSETNALIDGAIDFLRELSARYRLYAVTNGFESIQMGRIRAANIDKYFREIFISQKIGSDKPGAAFFDYCRDRIGFSIESTALVGDSLTSDVKGGVAYGLYTIWYDPNGLPCGEICPSAVARTYGEVLDILQRVD